MGIAIVQLNCVKQPIQIATQFVFTVLQAVEGGSLAFITVSYLQHNKHVCHLMRKANKETAQLRAVPKPLAQSDCVRCL